MSRLSIIDADGHVMEPFDLWQERLPAQFRDRAWKRQVDDAGRERVLFYGVPTELPFSTGALCTPGGLSERGSLDLDLDRDVDRGVDDPARRLALMDAQGIAASVLFPTMTLGLDDIPDPAFRQAQARAYNSWIAEFCAVDPVRLRWAAVLPLSDSDWAMAELERTRRDGAACAMLSPIPTPDRRTLGDASRDPVYARLEEAGIPAVVHAADPGSPTLGIRHLYQNRTQWQMCVPFQLQLAVLHVIDGGVLERFPELRCGFFEGDVGWLPHWIGRLDATYEKMALLRGGPATPALAQFRRQCVISGEPADPGLALTVGLLGADRVLWASDWPHYDGAWPDPIAALRDREDLSDSEKRAMFVDGPARFFRIDLGELLAHLGPGWRRDADLSGIPGLAGRRASPDQASERSDDGTKP